ncbi:hypothetical protein EGYY_14330 [Eggerthella sp. YY7918]|nr:hypothetical protein EGYY_14330 [Eggerthella sp. YY7918]
MFMSEEERREIARRKLEERTARTQGGSKRSGRSSRNKEPEGRRVQPRWDHAASDQRESGASRRSRTGSDVQETRGSRIHASLRSAATAIVETVVAIVSQVGLLRTLLIAASTLIVIVLAVTAIRGCSAEQAEPYEQNTAVVDEENDSTNVTGDLPQPTIDEAALVALVGEETTQKLVEGSASSEDLLWIAANPDALAIDGVEVQTKLLELAAKEPEAIPFVRNFPNAYPADSGTACDTVTKGEVPHLYQWDPRWAYTVYSSAAFGLTGCCPTSLSMVYQGLTGKHDLSPYDMGVRAQEGGYMDEYNGTVASFLIDEAPSLGLSCQVISVDADALRWALNEGAVVVCNVGAGDFTTDGHFFVITGLADDGSLVINDPYSSVRSSTTWDIDQVVNQTMGLYAYWAL